MAMTFLLPAKFLDVIFPGKPSATRPHLRKLKRAFEGCGRPIERLYSDDKKKRLALFPSTALVGHQETPPHGDRP
jgi:hypothetical protein